MQLVIAEKPSVAQQIASVIGAEERKDGYMEGSGSIVSWCVGHLVELAQPDAYSDAWKKWTYESLPMIPENWQHEVKRDTAAQYKVLRELMHDTRVDSVVCATDAGREGELIFRLVYEMAGCNKPMKRLWISSMEESAIRDGFANLKPGSDYDCLYQSALCRQRADWLVGLNGTRLFTVLYGGKVLKVGRVQTPTLGMLVERETQIMNFRKEQYFMAHILCGGVDAATGRINSRAEAETVAGACKNGQAVVTSAAKEQKSIAPPKLYDLTTLQRDANRLFGFTAKQTLEYVQSLYEKKLATYPRTDSQYLSDDMEQTAKSVIEAIFGSILFQEDVMFNPNIKRVLNSKKVTDHHAIIPTMEIAKADLSTLPELTEGQTFENMQTKISEHYTTPPKHYTEDSLLSAMERAGAEDMGDNVERKGLGTPATRADIIEKLVKDGFVKREKKQMLPTEDGMKLITVLPDVVKSPKLTADWENALTLVAKGEYSMQEFMGGIEDMVRDLVQTYHSVSEEQKSMFGGGAQGINAGTALGKCPKCGGDVVKGKFGAYCKNKCGMNVGRAMGAVLSDSQIKSMLEGKKTLVKGLKGKKGTYDAYLIPEGIEDYSYTKDGKEIRGSQYKVRLEFPKRKK